MNVGVRVAPNPVRAELARDVERLRELWGEGLERFGGAFLAGPAFTAADAFFAPVVFRVRTYGLDVGEAGGRWIETMLALPAMREWEEAALDESWREEAHEAELRTCGRIVEDHRRA